VSTPASITIRQLKEGLLPLQFEILAGEQGLDNKIGHYRIQKSGLALAGFIKHLHRNRVQVLGETEITYLSELPSSERKKRVYDFIKVGIPCIVLTKGLEAPMELLDEVSKAHVPTLRTHHTSAACINEINAFLEFRLAPSISMHGVLVDVYGAGVLMLGDSGIGKSECALDLVVRGHRLVADDVVVIKRIFPNKLIGLAAELLQDLMEVRGLGIINIRDLFGIASVVHQKEINLVIKFIEWQSTLEYERLGLVEKKLNILNVDLPYLEMPVGPGRNIAIIVEVAARNQLLKEIGFDSAKELNDKLNEKLKR
jgi:HPr kinase/phosphorylase